jgi:hypothetical protein
MATRADQSPPRDEDRLKQHFESAVRAPARPDVRLDKAAARAPRARVAPSRLPRARVPRVQFRVSDYLPGGDYPVHDERDALRALLRGLGAEVLSTPTFLTSYSLVCDQTSSAYFAEFNLWTPGARGGARDSGSGGGLEARPLVAYRPSDPEPWVLISAAASPWDEKACDWHEAVQELFSIVGPGQLRSDYQTLEAACLAHTPPSAAEAARGLSDFLKRKKIRAAKARKAAAETRAALDEARAKLLKFDKLVGMHLANYEWREPAGAAEPVVLYTLCTVDANREVVFAPARTYKELNSEERAYVNKPGAGSVLFNHKKELADAARLEKSVRELEANLASLAALTDDEYDRLKWLRDAAETLADFFTAKLLTTVPRGPRQVRTGGFPAPPARAAEGVGAGEAGGAAAGAGGAAGEDELSDSEGRKRDPFAWDSDLDKAAGGEQAEEEEEEEDEEAEPPSKKAKLSKPPRSLKDASMREEPGAMRTCKFNYRTGKRCGGGLKPDNSVRCACHGSDCHAQKHHTGSQCRCGAHIRCLLEYEIGDDETWFCRECRPWTPSCA